MKSKMVSVGLIALLLLSGVSAYGQDPDDVYWDSTLANFNGGLDGPVSDLAVYDGKLIVAGNFTTAGGILAYHIAAWDGQSWSSLETGVDASSPILTIYDGCLIAGCDYGARAWDGFSWSQLGSGIGDLLPSGIPWKVSPNALAVLNDTLFAAWNATTTTSENTNSVGVIMSWDGTSWSHYADAAGGVADRGLVGYHGRLFWSPSVTRSSWYTDGVGSGIAGSYGGAMGVCKDRILISFTDYYCGIIFEMNECYWETRLTAWGDTDTTILWFDYRPTLPGPFSPPPPLFLSFGTYDGTIILGGCLPGGNIARLSGSDWIPLGSGVSGQSWSASVSAVAAYGGRLIAGGDFTSAGGKSSPYLAVWTKRFLQCGDADGSGEVNLVDIVYHVNWIFAGGPAPIDAAAGDCNCDSRPNIGDAVYLVNYLYLGGPAPCAACP